ncbi:hypothetical protein TUM12370_32650 [Salmonella enterica subsp. enterica serovar Choleraesuis]|nr:hypothetical protein TUM12370_32650 [Salmonella enterica subsp. enterica serovar Choleraesuis]
MLGVLQLGSQWDLESWRWSVMAALLATMGLLYIPGWRGFTLLTAALAVAGTAMMVTHL